MRRPMLITLLTLLFLAGCSAPTPESNTAKEPGAGAGPTVATESVAPDESTLRINPATLAEAEPHAKVEVQAEAERKDVARPSPMPADAMAAAPAKEVGQRGLVLPRQAAPASLSPPAWNRESYNAVQENGFVNVSRSPLSTFGIDVDTASYANVRRFVNSGALPPVGAVRIEEMVNAFSYDYPDPEGRDPVALSAEVGPSPFHSGYQLARIGLAAKEMGKEQLPPSNLVLLIDVSGSMQDANKLPLLKQALPLLVRQMGARDRVAVVVYAGADSVVLQPTPGNRQREILAAIEGLRAGGSTHASAGIRAAYRLARKSFLPDGNNRVILASDGDFNVGVTSRDELQRLIETERQAGVHLTVLGFGMGNYHDDTMEILADKGNGNYAYIDSLLEAEKVLVKELSGTLFTLAGDVKMQVEFNPARVGAYRLIGYENRALAAEDFRDDRKDAGEIGVGHRVTALYELIPAGHSAVPRLDSLRYQAVPPAPAEDSAELLTVKLRYKPRGSETSRQMSLPVREASGLRTSVDFRFAAAVAGYGMLLTHSEHLGTFTWDQCLDLARSGRGFDAEGQRAELYRLVVASSLLARQQEGRKPGGEPLPVLR
ncbi:VWA domain-containing protein [Desulfobulbus sp.]|uniref:vWA domain-containing protein n=1 Tax=Desulfobulbus sp. TaxID=895 RepID=UPI00286F4E4A|nr:VWA domain-containing protein [Desulfobulbus sp.]